MRMKVLGPTDPDYANVKSMVATVFARQYGASVNHLPERVLAILDSQGQPLCTAGMRDAVSGIFCECYLDQRIERAIAQRGGPIVERSQILELTALAAQRPGALALLLRGFADYGLSSGYRWGVFTATERLRQMARRIGIELLELADARPERVDRPEQWGSYYSKKPVVCAVEGWSAAARLQNSPIRVAPQDPSIIEPTAAKSPVTLPAILQVAAQ